MAGDMHLPTFDHPHCWLDPDKHPPESLTIRAPWSHDGGALCGDARSDWHRERQEEHTPQCAGCSRRLRAKAIDLGQIDPHPSVKTGPLRNGVRVAKRMPFPGLTWPRWMRSEG